MGSSRNKTRGSPTRAMPTFVRFACHHVAQPLGGCGQGHGQDKVSPDDIEQV